MSYSSIFLMVCAVLAILVGGFIAILLIDLLFDVFDGLKARWTKRQQAGGQRVQIDRETARELERCETRLKLHSADSRAARGLGVAGVVRPALVPRDPRRRYDEGFVHGYTRSPGLSKRQARMAGHGPTRDEKPMVGKPQPAASGRGPGRGDPPKGVNGDGH